MSFPSLTAKLEAENPPEKPARKQKVNGAPRDEDSIFSRVREVDTVAVLDWLGIEHNGKHATCPGCQEEGALICKDGGLKCLHNRCTHVGPAGHLGFRSNVDIVIAVQGGEPREAAKAICERFGIEIPTAKKANGSSAHTDLDDHLDSRADEGGDLANWAHEPHENNEEAPSILAERWVHLGDDDGLLITTEPPPQTWLLKQAHRGRDVGVFPRGRTALLTATGGVGKTYSLIDLAVAVASGGFWFGEFRAVEPGHVLLALAEEDLDEARRRLWKVCNARELSLDERREIANRVDLLPMAGVPVALSASPTPGIITPTPFYGELCDRLEDRGVEWSLIILDPLSRWAGGGVEGDNEAATRFCQIVEGLSRAPGNPSVLVAHHSSKTSARDGAADARGVTGIRDGFRWQASLDPLRGEGGLQGAKLTNRKSNYSRLFEDVILVKNDEPGTEGTLRVATDGEASLLGVTPGGVTDDDYSERVLDTIRSCPGLTTVRQVLDRTKGKRNALHDTLKDLLRDGRVAKGANGYEALPSEK